MILIHSSFSKVIDFHPYGEHVKAGNPAEALNIILPVRSKRERLIWSWWWWWRCWWWWYHHHISLSILLTVWKKRTPQVRRTLRRSTSGRRGGRGGLAYIPYTGQQSEYIGSLFFHLLYNRLCFNFLLLMNCSSYLGIGGIAESIIFAGHNLYNLFLKQKRWIQSINL